MNKIIFMVLLVSLLGGCFEYSPLCYPSKKSYQKSVRQRGSTIEQLPNAIVGKPYSAVTSPIYDLFTVTFAPGDMGLTWHRNENSITIYGVPKQKGVITIYAINTRTIHTLNLCPNYSVGFRRTYKILVEEE